MKRRSLQITLVWLLFLSAKSHPVGVPNLHVNRLVESADVIAIAEVSAIEMIGPAPPMYFREQRVEAQQYSARLRVKRVLKGALPNDAKVKYSLPISFIGYRGLRSGTRLLFLHQDRDGYGLADAYYPDFPAIWAPPKSDSLQLPDVGRMVIRELLAVIASNVSSPEQKSEVLRVDYAFPENDEVVTAFRDGLVSTSDPELKQRLLGELVRLGDVSELPDVTHLLLTKTATSNQRIWLLYVIGNRLKNPQAIPLLQPLLRSDDNSLRGAAVEALWHIADPAAVPELATALHDQDERVRFYAVRAFADLANEPGWGGPSESEFHARQQEYLAHWESWAKERTQ